jgi:hypothetical protein
MTTSDFGPVPVSRLKGEIGNIYEALEHGRRVLVSRHGEVVAVIQPATAPHVKLCYQAELAHFAVTGPRELSVLTATDFGQGSPSAFIRTAEIGIASLVSRENRIYGVLTSLEDDSATTTESADFVDARERHLAQFERDHPDATADDFAREVAGWRPTGASAHDTVHAVARPLRFKSQYASMFAKAREMRDSGELDEDLYETLLNRLLGDNDDVKTGAAMTAELGMLYMERGDTKRAKAVLAGIAHGAIHGQRTRVPPAPVAQPADS